MVIRLSNSLAIVAFPINRNRGPASVRPFVAPTGIGWTAREIILPTMPGSLASAAIIRVAGITGRIRGMKYKRSDGQAVRPTLVVLDDPQTDESARSLSQCANRESILAGAVLGLAGPGKKISGIMPCTVIRPGDMADSILDRDKHPEWNGERTKMVYSFPENEKLWLEYAELRADSLRAGRHGEEATEFYRPRRTEMDKGAVVAWPERYNPDEISALQHAMNLRLRDEAAFFAEYQNEPLLADVNDDELTADQIGSRLNKLARGVPPIAVQHITMFIDVQGTLLYYVVCGWEKDFTGYVLDYGTWPDQQGGVLTPMNFVLVFHLADVDDVGEQLVDARLVEQPPATNCAFPGEPFNGRVIVAATAFKAPKHPSRKKSLFFTVPSLQSGGFQGPLLTVFARSPLFEDAQASG